MPAARADDKGTIDPGVATALSDLHAHLAGGVAPLAFGVLVVATAAVGFRHGALPRWLALISAVLGAALILPVAPWVAIMFFPFRVVAMSILLYRRQGETTSPERTIDVNEPGKQVLAQPSVRHRGVNGEPGVGGRDRRRGR